jgi:hypothetical protein
MLKRVSRGMNGLTIELCSRNDGRTGIPVVRTQSRFASLHESLYQNRALFTRCAVRKLGAMEEVDMADLDVLGAVDAVKGSLRRWRT